MKKKITVVSIFLLLAISITRHVLFASEFDPKAGLNATKVLFSYDRPRGVGRFEPRTDNLFKKTDNEVYIYVELDNCKPERRERYYHINLVMGIDIYYEDGLCIFSEEEANIFDHQLVMKNSTSFVWAKLDPAFLKEGEYKLEMTIRDENSGKEAFVLTRFTVI